MPRKVESGTALGSEPTVCIYDIETGPLPEEVLVGRMPDFKPKEGTKDKIKAAEQVMEKEEAYMRKAALSAQSGEVLVIGVRTFPRKAPSLTMFLEGDEKDILKAWWNIWTWARPHCMIGWNVKLFDMPFLIRRSWLQGVPVPCDAFEGRYFGARLIDAMDVWNFFRSDSEAGSSSLEAVASCFGLKKYGDGATFARDYKADRKEGLKHCARDLDMTEAVARAMGILNRPEIPE